MIYLIKITFTIIYEIEKKNKYIPPSITKVDDSSLRLFIKSILWPLTAMKINETRRLAIKNTKLMEWIIYRWVQS